MDRGRGHVAVVVVNWGMSCLAIRQGCWLGAFLAWSAIVGYVVQCNFELLGCHKELIIIALLFLV